MVFLPGWPMKSTTLLSAILLSLLATVANAADITGVPKIREGGQVQIGNQQRIRFTNQRDDTQRFDVAVLSPADATLVVSESPVVVAPEKVVTVNAVTTVPQSRFHDVQATVGYLVTSDGGYREEIEFLLLGPYDAEGRDR